MDKKEADLAYHKSMLVCHQRILHEIDAVIKSTERAIDELEKQGEPEHKFYIGQPVLVKNVEDALWRTAFFNGLNAHNYFYCKSTYDAAVCGTWDECKPDLDFKTMPNWIEWKGGEMPLDGDAMVAAEVDDGTTFYGTATDLNSYCAGTISEVIRYAVINLPEWVE